jgi:hypothetical protein
VYKILVEKVTILVLLSQPHRRGWLWRLRLTYIPVYKILVEEVTVLVLFDRHIEEAGPEAEAEFAYGLLDEIKLLLCHVELCL